MIDQSQALQILSHDPALKQLIDRFGPLHYSPENDIFISLVETIINQQLSGRAAATIYSRFKTLFPEQLFTPELLFKTTPEILRSAGISGQKAGYLHDLAAKILDGTLDFPKLSDQSDEEVIRHLTQVKGIGRWSAEMILMFTFHRPDVLPLDDLGIRNAFAKFYGIKNENRSEMVRIAKSWQPYRTVACWYLWKGLDNR